MTTVKCYLGLGGNIETASSTRFDFLFSAVRQFAQREDVEVVSGSHVYETAPVGYDSQENFYNAVIEIATELSPKELLRVCIDVVEKRAGRARTIQDGPRTLDVDILTYGDQSINEEGLEIPHPRMNERAFVIVPLSEIAPEYVGNLGKYTFIDSIDKVVKLEDNFDELIASYKAV